MGTNADLCRPRLVAVWPGMGHVAINAGIYLLSKLQMTLFAEFDTVTLFDVESVGVNAGLIHPVRRPRNRLFLWTDPAKRHDLLVFVGEAQPPSGKYTFCRELIRYALGLGIERVYTFAAMATQMHPEDTSRVFVAATDADRLNELRQLELELLEDGQIGGLNGILLGAALEDGLTGACLLGEMPHLFAQLPFPKASLAILEAFTTLCGIELDLSELSEQAARVERHLGELLARVEAQLQERGTAEEEVEYTPELPEEVTDPEIVRRVERLFEGAAADRSKAFELKQELDKSGLFKEYEDRFLDLFRKPNE